MDVIRNSIQEVLSRHPEVRLCIIFGSIASGKDTPGSDVDIAVAAAYALSAEKLLELSEDLSAATKREVDLLDLNAATGLISQQALSTGVIVQNDDKDLYAKLISKMLVNQADMMPYHDRILTERRRRFLNE